MEADRGIVLIPVGSDMEDFETGVVRSVGRLLCVGADDVRDRVTESWRGKFRTGKRWKWRGKFGVNGIAPMFVDNPFHTTVCIAYVRLISDNGFFCFSYP